MSYRKNSLFCICFIIVSFWLLSAGVQGQTSKTEVEQILKDEIAPRVVNGIGYIPVKKFYESLGWQVQWDYRKRAVTVKNDKRQVEFSKGSSTAIIDTYYEVLLESPVVILENRAYICSSFVIQEFGLKIKWDKEKNTLLVAGDESPVIKVSGRGNVIVLSHKMILNIYETYGMDTVRDMLLLADSLLCGGKPGEALQKYREVADNIKKEQCPDTYAYVLWGMGNALSAAAGLKDSRADLEAAVDLYFRAADIYREDSNPDYLLVYNNIGLCYSRLYGLTSEKQFLEQAKSLFSTAIEKLDAGSEKLAAAAILENLGKTLSALGDKEAARKRFAEAINTYDYLLGACSAEDDPEQWADITVRLGELYVELSFLYDSENNLLISKDYLDKALLIINIESYPLDYAKIHECLGDVYTYLFAIQPIPDYFNSAIMEYKESLSIYSADKNTVKADTVNNKLDTLYQGLELSNGAEAGHKGK